MSPCIFAMRFDATSWACMYLVYVYDDFPYTHPWHTRMLCSVCARVFRMNCSGERDLVQHDF